MAKKVDAKKKIRTRDKDGTQKKLLKAAIHIFATSGYDAATTKAIAEKAGVAEGLIMRYFKGKRGLLMAIMQDFAQNEINDGTNLPPKQSNLSLEFESFLNHALTHCAANKEYLSVAFPLAVIDRNAAKEMAKFMETSRVPAYMERFSLHRAEGAISSDEDIEAFAYTLALSMLSLGFIGQNVIRLDPKILNRVVKTLSRAFSSGLENKK